MGIKLDISVETPLSDDDRHILAGISAMVLANANRQDLADQAQQAQDYEDADESCVREPGHSGRHKYRSLSWQGQSLN